jgi:hypothetical protein
MESCLVRSYTCQEAFDIFMLKQTSPATMLVFWSKLLVKKFEIAVFIQLLGMNLNKEKSLIKK